MIFPTGTDLPGARGTTVVTGASSGIGVAVARELARRGRHVTLVARRADRMDALAAELRRDGSAVEVLPTDLSDPAARATLPARVAALGLVVEGLVNNAGVETLGPVWSADPHAEMHLIEVNVSAVVDLCCRFVPAMVERGRGSILNMGAASAFGPTPGYAGFGASKAFVVAYTRSLAAELRGTGVTAVAYCPGAVLHDEPSPDEVVGALWASADLVGRRAVDAMGASRPVVVPGLQNRLAAFAARVAPEQGPRLVAGIGSARRRVLLRLRR